MPNHTSNQALRAALGVLVAAIAPLLAACSGEPSSSEVEKAVSANAAQGSKQMEQLSQGSSKTFMPQVHSVKKLGCRQETGSAYLCDVELDVTSQGVRGKVPTSMRFVKGPEGWVVSR